MEQLPSFGKAIGQIIGPTYKTYAPLLVKNTVNIRSTPRQTFSYGPHPRQKLDVYTPRLYSPSSLRSVLIYLYGGGLAVGDRIEPNFANDLNYANLGHFFAEELGATVVVPDYRLLKHGAKFPSGGEDLAATIAWIEKSYGQNESNAVSLSIMGHSAGSIHLATYLLAPDFAESRQKILRGQRTIKLESVVFLSAPFHFKDANTGRIPALETYYGSDLCSSSPLGLLRARAQAEAGKGDLTQFKDLSVMMLNGSLDPEIDILVPRNDFIEEWCKQEYLKNNLVVVAAEGHNHISPPLSLGTGIEIEEAWGKQVIKFIKTHK